MKPKFGPGQRVKWTGGLSGTVESVFLTAAHAWMAQIARPRVRLLAKIEEPASLPRPRVGRPFARPSFHYLIVRGKAGAFVREAELELVSGRPAPSRFRLGASATAPWDFHGVITSVHRNFRAAVLAGLVAPGWFAAQQLRPRSRTQVFYSLTGDGGLGSVLAGEAEMKRYRPGSGRGRS